MNNSDQDSLGSSLAEIRSLGYRNLGWAACPQKDFSWVFSFEGLDSVQETRSFSFNSCEDFHSDRGSISMMVQGGNLFLASFFLIVNSGSFTMSQELLNYDSKELMGPSGRSCKGLMRYSTRELISRSITYSVIHKLRFLMMKGKTTLCKTAIRTLAYDHCLSLDFLPPCHTTGFYGYTTDRVVCKQGLEMLEGSNCVVGAF